MPRPKSVRLSLVDSTSGRISADLGEVMVSNIPDLLPKQLTYRGRILSYDTDLPWNEKYGKLTIEFGENNTVLISVDGKPLLSAMTIPEMEVAKMFARELHHCNK